MRLTCRSSRISFVASSKGQGGGQFRPTVLPRNGKEQNDASYGDGQGDEEFRGGNLPGDPRAPEGFDKLFEQMGKFNEELVSAGVMLAVDGLKPSSKGKRVRFTGSRGELQQIVDATPLAALWMLELSYALGCLVAGVVTAVGARGRRLTLALVVGGIFTVMGFVNLAQFPAPLWLALVTTITFVPATLAGAWVVSRLQARRV